MVTSVVWGGKEPVGDAGEGFLLAKGMARGRLEDKGERWRRDEGVWARRRGRCEFFVDGF